MNFIGDNEGFGDWDSKWMKLTELWDKLPTVAACEFTDKPKRYWASARDVAEILA